MDLKEFLALYEQSIIRGKAAHDIAKKYNAQILELPEPVRFCKKIHNAAERYERYQIIAELAQHP